LSLPHIKQRSGTATLCSGVALCLTAFALFLHVRVLLNAGGLWRDEANSAQFALMPSFSTVLGSLRYDSYPVGSTAFFRCWTLLTTSDQGFRTAGFVVGLGIASALWWNSRTLRLGVPLLSLVLLAANPVAVRYGDSVRPYGLGVLFTLIAFGFFARLIDNVSAPNIIGAAGSAILCVQCLYQTSILIAAFSVAGVVVAVRGKMYRTACWIVAAGALAALSLLPYLGDIRAAGDWAMLARMPVAWEALGKVAAAAFGAQAGFMVYIWCGLCVIGVGVGVVFTRASAPGTRKQKDLIAFAGLSLILAGAGFAAFIHSIDLPTQTWYYLPVMAPCAVCLDILFSPVIRKPAFNLALAALAVFVVIATASQVWEDVRVRATNIDLVASALTGKAGRNDLIILSPWFMGVGFHRAYHGETPWMSLPPLDDLSIHRFDLVKSAMATDDPMQPLLQAVGRTLSSGNRVWIIGWFATPAAGQAPPPLPRAPNGPMGWNFVDYNNAWILQLGSYVRAHSSSASSVSVQSPNPVNPLENLPLLRVSGWRP